MENTNKQDTGLTCFVILAKLKGEPVDIEQIKLSNLYDGRKMDAVHIIQLAKAYKLKGRIHKYNINKEMEIIAPIIAQKRDGEFFIIAKNQDTDYMVLFPENNRPQVVNFEELKEIWDGTSILISKRGIIDKEAVFGFKWFIPTVLKFKSELVQVLIAVFVIQLLGILTPVMMQVVIDKVLAQRVISTLYSISIGILLVYIFEYIISLGKNYVFTHTTNRIDVILSYRLFKHLFDLPLKYFEARRVGETVARVRELDSIRSFLTGTPLSSMIDLLFIVVYIVILFCYNTKLTLIVLASIPVFAILSAVVTPIFKKRLDEKFATGAEAQSFLVESITGIQTVKSFSVEPKFVDKWGDLQAEYVKASYKTSMISATASTTGQFIQKIFDLLILFFAAKAVMDGDFTVGQLVAFRMLSSRVSTPVLRLVQLWQEYQQASLSVKRIADIFNSPTENVSSASQISVPRLKGHIRFDKVRFRYNPEGAEVIKNVSFGIRPGDVVGVVGRSGSGKSTVSKLIQRLYIPEAGKISIDGLDISLMDSSALRKQIGVVLQENFMFNGTVRENISIHLPGTPLEEVIKSAQIAGAHEFIMQLPNGYDTIIGEKGVGLSGGQKQRVAIARAILGNPGILIFDEATSALDYESESIIQKNLKHICKDRTVIIIAHRLSTIKDANKIMVIDDGSVVEYGTHENLINKKGFYYNLYTKQQRNEVDG